MSEEVEEDEVSIAPRSNGGFFVTWEAKSDNPDGSLGVYGRLFNP